MAHPDLVGHLPDAELLSRCPPQPVERGVDQPALEVGLGDRIALRHGSLL